MRLDWFSARHATHFLPWKYEVERINFDRETTRWTSISIATSRVGIKLQTPFPRLNLDVFVPLPNPIQIIRSPLAVNSFPSQQWCTPSPTTAEWQNRGGRSAEGVEGLGVKAARAHAVLVDATPRDVTFTATARGVGGRGSIPASGSPLPLPATPAHPSGRRAAGSPGSRLRRGRGLRMSREQSYASSGIENFSEFRETDSAMLRKNAVKAFRHCKISFYNFQNFEGICEYFSQIFQRIVFVILSKASENSKEVYS